MALAVWSAFGEEWGLAEPVSFNGLTKLITVNSGVTSLDINDVYSAWVRWTKRETWAEYAMRYSGYDPIPGGRTGRTFFLINGWKLCYDPNVVAVAGVLYSEDYDTAYWSLDASDPIYPATVSALVNSAVSYQNVVTGTALTEAETGEAVWTYINRTLTSMPDVIVTQIVAAIMAQAQTTPIHSDIRKVNNVAVTGTGAAGNEWGPA